MKKQRLTSGRSTRAPTLSEAAGPALRELLRLITPPDDVRRHFRTARVEVLKGLRALIEARIEHLSKSGGRGEKINVE